MNIGIKYCGGCNPHFDRTDVINKIMGLFKDDKFEYAKENNSYDIIIVINGCNRACSDHSSLRSKKKIFINSEEDYLEVIELIYKHKKHAYMNTLTDRDVEIVYNTTAKELIQENGKVTGVKGTDIHGNTYTFNANKSVILCTGGFSGNQELVSKYVPKDKWSDLSSVGTTNLPSVTGDGIFMAQKVGADLRDMDQIQLLFTCDPKTGLYTNSTLRPKGAAGVLFINKEGHRFVREDGRCDDISLAMMAQTDGIGYFLQNADSEFSLDMLEPSGIPISESVKRGIIHYGETLKEACESAGLPYEEVQKTVDEFNAKVDICTESDEFGRLIFTMKFENGPWFITPRAPSRHHTMGGVVIDKECHVLNESGEVIEGLYAAGEIVGGIHGGNRLGGNAIVDTVVFGRIAGKSASK